MDLPLRNMKGEVIGHAQVDDDFAYADHRWSDHGNGYVESVINGVKVYLHRLVMGVPRGDKRFVDHIDRNPRNCRRSNLRIVTPAQSSQNSERKQYAGRPVRSQYRGVSVCSRTGKFVAYAKLNGIKHHLGTFTDELAAAETARRWRIDHMTHSGDSVVAA